jgi:hypothetical protein
MRLLSPTLLVACALGCATGTGIDTGRQGDDGGADPWPVDGASGPADAGERLSPDAGSAAAPDAGGGGTPDAGTPPRPDAGPPPPPPECTDGARRDCASACGSTGTQGCAGGAWGACAPPAETCSGVDDDCDGSVDEGTLCGAGEACRAGRCERVEWVFEAEGPAMGHIVGRAEAEGWSASTGADDDGYLVFGPYTREIPAGAWEAVFRLMIDNRDADSAVVVRLNVNDFDAGSGSCGACEIASREVRRTEFGGTFAYQDFVVPFTSPGGGHRLELRTRWTDRAYIREDRITVRRAR